MLSINQEKKLELSKIYKYTFEMISGRLCCKKNCII